MSNLREEFEKLPEIAERLKGGSIYWNGYQNKYQTDLVNLMSTVCYINGAWFAFQEQQKKLDAVRKEINDFFDNQTMTPTAREYANKLADVLEILK